MQAGARRVLRWLRQGRPAEATPSGWIGFQLGVLLLASSLLLAVPPLFWALLEGSRHRRRPWLADPCNRLLLLVAGLMVLIPRKAKPLWIQSKV